PFNPIVRGSVTGGAGSLSLSGDYLYMGGGWLICVYIANTLSPQVVTAVDVPFFTPSISARHPYVFACRRNAGIFIYHNDNTVFVNTKNSDIFPDFLLEQNFPNPFNPKTDVRYEIRDASHVTLQVFDLLGREITTIVNENQYPGSYTVAWDASEMPTGIYLYRLNVINGKGIKFFSIKKMVLLR
ncbi:MAG: T9SS type A sorting domain-containing protein, partial [Bacteroidetes bacterium]